MFNEKAYAKKYRLEHIKEKRALQIKWRAENPDKTKKYAEKYRLFHREQTNKANKQWRKENPGQSRYGDSGRKFYLTHTEQIKERAKKWFETPKGKETKRKINARRRQLGFIPLNKHFPGSRGHHIDTERVIHMPRETHESVRHNLNTGRNMEKINRLAFEFLEGHDE